MTYYQQNVLAQIKTDIENLTLASTTNATVQTTARNKYATATRPINENGSLIVNAEGLSYFKVIPFFQSTATSPALRVIGWNQNIATGLWIPHLLCDVDVSLNGNNNSINGTNLQQVRTLARTYGDAKLYNSNSSPDSGGFLLVDTVGCSLIEFAFRCESGTASANAFYASI